MITSVFKCDECNESKVKDPDGKHRFYSVTCEYSDSINDETYGGTSGGSPWQYNKQICIKCADKYLKLEMKNEIRRDEKTLG